MNLKRSIFKAYDIRGKYPLEINEEIVREIISSFISKLPEAEPRRRTSSLRGRQARYGASKTPRSRAPKENKFPTGQASSLRGRQNSRFKIIVAHDARLSSPILYRAAIES